MIRIRVRNKERGFTLIEMIIVVAIIAILLGIAIPVYNIHLLHAREAVFGTDLASIRDAIGQFTQDKQLAPQTLDHVVSPGLLRALPQDPFTHSPHWQAGHEDVTPTLAHTPPRVTPTHP